MPSNKLASRDKIIVQTSIVGVVVNLLLVGFKGVVGLMAGSIAIMVDAVNNLTDAFSSIVTIVGTKLSVKPADKDHPYGYGRVEYFSAVVVAAIILYAGVIAIKESVEKIINPAAEDYTVLSLFIIAVAVLIKLGLGFYYQKIGKEVHSGILIASSKDAFSDVLLSFATLVSAVCYYIWHLELGGYLGVIIGAVIIKTAVEIMKEGINSIIGERADPELAAKLRKMINKYPEVKGTYDLSIHNYGPNTHIASVHIQVPHDMTAAEIHALSRQITFDVYKKFGIVITVGVYAANHTKYEGIQRAIGKFVEKHPEIKQVHGFFVDKEAKEVYFDVVVDFACEDTKGLLGSFKRELKKAYPEYAFNIILDADISD
ncbi:cation transporter [Candidatus Saccharibacteria bacterium]|nr:cation transporter [Candidatus Saccharibacteria bacterium]